MGKPTNRPFKPQKNMNYQETIEYLFNSTPVFEKIGAKAY